MTEGEGRGREMDKRVERIEGREERRKGERRMNEKEVMTGVQTTRRCGLSSSPPTTCCSD